MNVTATARYVRQSPRKVRLVATAVRELPPVEAINALHLTNARAAKVVADVIQSAVANATNNHHLQPSTLRIMTLEVGEGPTLKRIRARSRGMAHPVLKRTSHVRVVLTDEPAPEKRKAESGKPKESARIAPKAEAGTKRPARGKRTAAATETKESKE